MVVLDSGAFERQQETMALLKLLSLGKKEFFWAEVNQEFKQLT
jgi:hypothetical protein